MDNNIIGKYIEKKRKSKGLTQKELAKRLGLSNTAISKWECGCNLPDVAMLEPLSKELDVDVSKLVALQSGHVNYQSIEDLEETEETPSTENINESHINDKKFHINKKSIIFISIILVLIFATNILTINFSHSLTSTPLPQNTQNEVKVYKIVSEEQNFNIDGYMIYNKENHLILINEFNHQSTIKGTNEDPLVEAVSIFMLIDDQIVYKSRKEFTKKIKLSEALKESRSEINDEDGTETVNIYDLEDRFATAKLKIEYLTEGNQKEEIYFKISLKQLFI